MPHILFVSRSTLYSQPGGDTVQIEQTALHLRELGFTVDIAAGIEEEDPGKYDIVHFFNLIRPADILRHLPKINNLVVSSIYVDYRVVERKRSGFAKALVQGLFGKFGAEYIKCVLRWLTGGDRFPGMRYLLIGQYQAIEEILKKSRVVITASHYEQKLIAEDFPNTAINYIRVLLGSEHFDPGKSNEKHRDIACAARIEPLKNQLGLIRAVSRTGYSLDLYGAYSNQHKKYLRQCMKEQTPSLSFMGGVSQAELAQHLPEYRVHALPSFFETTGLASIEALVSGCSIVVSDHPIQRELFGEHAVYCDPESEESLVSAIEEAMKQSRDHRIWASENFSWVKAAREISDLYRKLQS